MAEEQTPIKISEIENTAHEVQAQDLLEVSVDLGSGLYATAKATIGTILAGTATQVGLDNHISDTNNPHSVTKAQVGLPNVDNTSDADKPVSNATQAALDGKVDKVSGKGLSTNDYTTAEKTKLAGIEAGAEVNEVSAADIADFETTTQLNARDTANRNRSNHTGTQAIATVSGLQTALDSKADDGHTHDDRYYTEAETDALLADKADEADIPSLPATIVESVVAGENVTIDNSDPANPVISSTGGGDGGGGTVSEWGDITGTLANQTDLQAALDAKADETDLHSHANKAVLDATTASFTTDDESKLDGIAAGAQVNEVSASDIVDFETTTELDARDTANRDRANHTGTQAIATVDGLQTALDGKADDLHSHTIADITNLQTSLDNKLEDVDIADINASGTADETTYLRGDGSWATPAGGGTELPDQTGNAGKFLTTDGASLSWDTPAGGGGSTPQATMSLAMFGSTGNATGMYNEQTSGSGAITWAHQYITLNTGTSSSSYARIRPHNQDTRTTFPSSFKNVKGYAEFSAAGVGDGDSYYRFFSSNGSAANKTARQMGFNVSKAAGDFSYYSSTGDGTTETSTLLTDVTNMFGQRQAFGAALDEGVSCKFYVVGVLKSTHTTNLPPSGGADSRQYRLLAMTENGASATENLMTLSLSSLSWDFY